MQIVPNTFTSYEFTLEEERKAIIFSDYQLAGLQNEIAKAAEEKLALIYNPLNTENFLQQEARLTGQLELLSYLIARSHQANLNYASDTVNSDSLEVND